jgi:outer membrane lipoprotein-sorting protein
MKQIRRWFWIILLLSLEDAGLAFAQTANAPDSLPPGEEMIKKSKELLYEIKDQKNKVTLKLIDMNGSVKEIVASRYWKNYHNEKGFSSKTVIFTEAPTDMRGQAILIWDYSAVEKGEDIWIYLPTLRNVRRVLPQQQDEAFMGSDLTFADMGQRLLNEDIHQTLKKESYRGIPCVVVESTPKEKGGLYSKKVTWVSEEDYTIQKIDYYDRNGRLLKRQTIDWNMLKDGEKNVYIWKKTDVVNVQNGHKTIFVVSDLKINMALADEDFTERVLQGRGLKK